MNWMQILALMGVNIALVGAMITIIVWVVNKMDADVKSACARLDGHTSRIDQLYRMFLDAQKEANERFNKVDQKFYDLLREKK